MSDVQRVRIVRAAAELACERGTEHMSVAVIVAAAGVSRKTFYELFENREDCMLDVFEHAIELSADVLSRVHYGQRGWAARVRAGLVEVLALLEREREIAEVALRYLVGDGARRGERQLAVLARLQAFVDEGRAGAKAEGEKSPLTAEVVVGGVLAVIERRVRTGREPLMALVNDLMWMIVLPYLGPAAAARELRAALPQHVVERRPRRSKDVRETLDMRMTYRTAGVLVAIADEPASSNREISVRAGISDQGQMSKLLVRLARLGLIENCGRGQALGASNAWELTAKGKQVERAVRRDFAGGHTLDRGAPRGKRRRGVADEE